MKRFSVLIFSVALSLLVTATLAALEDKKPVAAPVPVQKDSQKDSIDKPKAIAFYEYKAGGRRDPFIPLIANVEKPEIKVKKGQIPIESYDVSEFKLMALLWNGKGSYGVITLPNGKSYTIREGMKLGLHGGKVYKITKDSITVREYIRDFKGASNPKDTILKLRMEEEG